MGVTVLSKGANAFSLLEGVLSYWPLNISWTGIGDEGLVKYNELCHGLVFVDGYVLCKVKCFRRNKLGICF